MASFLEELWNGVFTPGTSPTLLVAANASFAALQLLLFVLFLSTYSIHFLILSFLCGALWYSINWFVVEVNKFQATTQAREGEEGDKHQEGGAAAARVPGAIDTESEAEMEGVSTPGGPQRPFSTATTSSASTAGAMRPPPVPTKASTMASSSGSHHHPAPVQGVEEVRQRNNPADSLGYVSTDSEWEKVDEKER